MKLLLLVLGVLASYEGAFATTATRLAALETKMNQHLNVINAQKEVLSGLSRQVMLQQFYLEEKIRSDGNSGLKHIRVQSDGTRNYFQTSHISRRNFMGIHDHANYDRTVGMGELNVVMNGVEFKTRHNDYKLRMPHPTSQNYNAMVDIPLPNVPQSVLNKHTVAEQIKEMRMYFKAFNDQNPSLRNYKPYFKPNLCYIEGAWTTATKNLNEPFQSDRHQIDAKNWFDLMAKARFTAYTGSKSVLENFATLPTTIMHVDDNNVPHYAQWNYRILCHPIKREIKTSWFKQEDDLTFRFANRYTMDKALGYKAQRFYLNDKSYSRYESGRSLMDKLMMEIPGKNNYAGELHDNSFGMVMEHVAFNNHTLLNSGRYHRYFKTLDKGAMGIKSIHRGFADSELWVAETSHPQVAPMTVEDCRRQRGRPENCTSYTTRYTYALPLEVVYLTPLVKWNPYDIAEHPNANIVAEGGRRNGLQNVTRAYNGTFARKFLYRTPSEFYTNGPAESRDPADTARKGAGVLDKNGTMRICESSGTRVYLPTIEGVGKIRLRYPIMPIHGEGSGQWKELNALKDMTQHISRYASLFEERPGAFGANGTMMMDDPGVKQFEMTDTVMDPPGEHTHDFYLSKEEIDELKHRHIHVTTSENQGHSHELELRWIGGRTNKPRIHKCDGMGSCWDGHDMNLHEI